MVRSYGLINDVVTAFNHPSEYHFNVIDTPLMRDTVEALKAIPLFEVPSGMAAADIRTTARHLSCLADWWDNLISAVKESGNPFSNYYSTELVAYCKEVMSITLKAVNECKEGIRARGGTWS